MTDWVGAVALGIIEGITEFIPVSSTGHLLLAEHLLGLKRSDLFNVVIQCGAVIAALPFFRERLRQFAFQWRETATRDYALKIFTAFAMTGVGGLILEKNHFKLPEEPLPVAVALFVGGVLFLVVERWLLGKTPREEVSWPAALAVGIGQLVAAAFPGVSRSGATILPALAFGLGRPAAAEFSFLVGIPTMLAAGGLKIVKALYHPPDGAPPEDWGMLVLAALVACAVSFLAVRWLLRFIQTRTFTPFGWYRILTGTVILILVWAQ